MKLKNMPGAGCLARCALLAAVAGAPLVAAAAEGASRTEAGVYIGGGIGYDRLNGEDFSGGNDDVDDKRVTYKGLAGIRLGSLIALEAQYIDFGTAEDGGNRVNADGVTAGIVVDVPVLPFIRPYGKAGALFWETDERYGGLLRSREGTDFTYGVGVRFTVSDHVDLRAEYERFELDNNDVDNVSAMLQINF